MLSRRQFLITAGAGFSGLYSATHLLAQEALWKSSRADVPQNRTMPDPMDQELFSTKFDSYIGLWHAQGSWYGKYGPKYSGGLATYTAKHRPIAVYSSEADKTFFCYGGTSHGNYHLPRKWNFEPGHLYHMVSYFDHKTGMFPKPTLVFDKWCSDPHDNPVIQIDKDGYLFLFSPSHGPWTTRSFIHKSVRPYDIDEWETVYDSPLYAYPQVHYHDENGWFMLHTIYGGGRRLYFKTSKDGISWSDTENIAGIHQGHYQNTSYDPEHGIIGTAFNYHPQQGGLDERTNLYYMETRDWGKTWQNIAGEQIEIPVTEPENPALVKNFQEEGDLVYMKDIDFDSDGNPVILFIRSKGHEPGPENGPRTWTIARRNGDTWTFEDVTTSDHNYDMGSLYIHRDPWQIIAPTGDGPQKYMTGGEMALHQRMNETWQQSSTVTTESQRNHTYARRPLHSHDDFAAFWADGNPFTPSISFLYFCDVNGDNVYRLPMHMTGDFSKPYIHESN